MLGTGQTNAPIDNATAHDKEPDEIRRSAHDKEPDEIRRSTMMIDDMSRLSTAVARNIASLLSQTAAGELDDRAKTEFKWLLDVTAVLSEQIAITLCKDANDVLQGNLTLDTLINICDNTTHMLTLLNAATNIGNWLPNHDAKVIDVATRAFRVVLAAVSKVAVFKAAIEACHGHLFDTHLTGALQLLLDRMVQESRTLSDAKDARPGQMDDRQLEGAAVPETGATGRLPEAEASSASRSPCVPLLGLDYNN